MRSPNALQSIDSSNPEFNKELLPGSNGLWSSPRETAVIKIMPEPPRQMMWMQMSNVSGAEYVLIQLVYNGTAFTQVKAPVTESVSILKALYRRLSLRYN